MLYWVRVRRASQGGMVVKNPSASAGDTRDIGSIPGSGRSPGEGNGNPLQYSRPEKPMDRGDWWATVHGVADYNRTEHSHNPRGCILGFYSAS